MGPPRTRRARSVNPSRFHEGSMNDRVSAAPPVQFLDPNEREELERPATRSQARPVSDDWADKQVKKGRLLGHVWEEVRGRLGFRREGEEGSRRRERSRKGDGEREEGRRERSRLRSRSRGRDRSRGREEKRDESVKAEKRKVEKAREERPKEETPKTEMPTREEILANYHNLVAAGFFTSHAIQSTRQPPRPAAALPDVSATPSSKAPSKIQTGSLSASKAPTRSTTPQPPPPRAPTPSVRPQSSGAKSPLTSRKQYVEPPAATYDQLVASGFFSPPTYPVVGQPSLTPAPASAAPAPVVYSTRSTRDYLQPPTPKWTSRTGTPSPSRAPSPIPSPGSVSSRGTKRAAADIPTDDEGEENTAHDPPTPKRKLRKTASRDIGLPKLRSVASRRAMAPRRSVSGPSNNSREYNLARRVLGRLPGANSKNNPGNSDRQQSAPRRSASGSLKAPSHESTYSRVLRSRKSAKEALRSGKNANRAPETSSVPHKFVSCEDRENGAPYLTIRF